MSAALDRVAAALAGDGGLLAQALLAPGQRPPDDGPQLGALAAAGPRAAGVEARIAAVVEAAYEGHLLHLGRSRILATDDRDLALLAGDRLYALGLAGLAELGDVDAVHELADVIGLCAQARAEGDAELASAAWRAGATAIGWGTTPALEAAKAAARRGDAGAPAALSAAARQLGGDPAPGR
ncbi:MAG TPA: hypothetical protein VMT10_10225 [Solirubrobacteraceae bacterium]|nr:hypothetical protein [Solirubrobacteraceae bacterium]